MSSPSLGEVLTVLLEVEDLERTRARFPGLSYGELRQLLKSALPPSPAGHAPSPPPGLALTPPPSRAPVLSRSATTAPPRSASGTPARSPGSPAPDGRVPLARSASQAGRSPPERDPTRVGMKVLAWSDGASRGNPGAASVGVILKTPDGRVLDRIARSLGRRTNNYAEYEAVRQALARALELGAESLELAADSELVIRQLTGVYRVKNPDLKPLFEAVKALEQRFVAGVTYRHVYREQNREADELANLALDEGR